MLVEGGVEWRERSREFPCRPAPWIIEKQTRFAAADQLAAGGKFGESVKNASVGALGDVSERGVAGTGQGLLDFIASGKWLGLEKLVAPMVAKEHAPCIWMEFDMLSLGSVQTAENGFRADCSIPSPAAHDTSGISDQTTIAWEGCEAAPGGD